MPKVKIKCRNNNCLRIGDFSDGNGICPKCIKLMTEGIKKRKKPISKKSLRPRPVAYKRACDAFQKKRRLEEANDEGKCICVNGEWRDWWLCDGGHFWGKKQYPNVIFDPMNVHPQSKMANKNMSCDPAVVLGYKAYLIDRYGHEAYNDLERRAKIPKKWTTFELEKLAEIFEQEIEKILKERNWK